MKYSIIVPAHNEGEHVEPFLSDFLEHLPEEVDRVLTEVLLIENGSRDDTMAACERLVVRYPDRVKAMTVERPSYGEAIKHGMLSATGDYLSILEVDYLEADFVKRSVEMFQAGQTRFIVASKRHPESVDGRPWKRRMLTLGFNKILNYLVGYPGSDTHGLKSIETALAKELCALTETTDEVFQTELVLLAWRLGHTIEELPIRLKEMRPAPVSVARRMPKVIDMVRQLKKSINRFPRKPTV